MQNPIYLGDSVYAYFDGFGIELRLNSHTEPCSVYIEPDTFLALTKFMEAIKDRAINDLAES